MQETLGGFYYIIFGGIGIVVPILIFVLLMPVMEFLANIKYVQIGFVLIAVLIGGVYAYSARSEKRVVNAPAPANKGKKKIYLLRASISKVMLAVNSLTEVANKIIPRNFRMI